MLRELEAFRRERRSLFYPKADLPVPDALLRGVGAAVAGGGPPYAAAAARACREVFGEAPAEVRPLGELGTFHVLYRATLADRRRVVVRLNALGERGPDYLLHLDPWANGLLGGANLPSLAVYEVDVSRSRCPFDFQILQEARGVTLKALDDDEARLTPLLYELGRLVARLHGLRTRGFGFFDVGPLVLGEGGGHVRGECPTWREYVLRRLEDHVGRCADLGAVTRDETRRIQAAFASGDDLFDDVEPSLLHGDLGSHNVFTDGRTITALIDWEDGLSGDPAYDVAFWATFHPERRHGAFLDGYRRERPLTADFARRFWLYFLRVALAKTVLRHRLGLADRPGRPPASLRIQKSLEQYEVVERGRPLAA